MIFTLSSPVTLSLGIRMVNSVPVVYRATDGKIRRSSKTAFVVMLSVPVQPVLSEPGERKRLAGLAHLVNLAKVALSIWLGGLNVVYPSLQFRRSIKRQVPRPPWAGDDLCPWDGRKFRYLGQNESWILNSMGDATTDYLESSNAPLHFRNS
ncbi:hypothetical protein B0T22DRAFT_192199 [Podospora appendiculata]|uniref:Uncharacterized protein n=1 Tax=Podospora appendiculata TaxID=314037 RepID=A0AAE1CEE6_9PEZI|nr:hypothetical protein B0T22DRAFT_192199 [Podospora appendiculata]